MPRQSLLAWQWSDYAQKHRDRANLLIHIVAVPVFHAGVFVAVAGLVGASWPVAVGGLAGVGVSLAAQGRGHRLEREAPAPFDGAADAVRRLLAEQLVTFPRFVLTGGWRRGLRGDH